MKKLTLFFIVMFTCGLLFAQDVTETFTYTDNWTFVTPLYLPDGSTAIPGGYLIEVCLPVVPGVMDYENDWHGPALTNPGSVQQMVIGFDGFFMFSPAFYWYQPGGGTEPCANTGESIYLRIYDAVDVVSAENYMNSGWLLGLAGGPYDTEVDVWEAWAPIPGAGLPIPPAGGTVAFPSGGSVTFLAGNSGTIDLAFDPANPPPTIPVPTPQNLWWDYDTSGANITVWPVTLRLEFPLSAGVTYASSAILHETEAVWYALVDGNPIAAHPANLPHQATILASMVYDFSTDPSFVEFETWTLSDWGMDSENPLPVTLTSFTAVVVQNEFISINWTTQSECNMVGYKVHRSESDYASVDLISEIISAENTTEPHDYIYNDSEVLDGVTYNYWLEGIDYDGSTNLWGPISATMEGEIIPELPNTTQLFGNYPNPFNPETVIKLDIKEGETGELTIFNVKGQVVESMRLNADYHEIEWDAKSVTSGVYFYKLKTESYTEIKKMMLLK